MNIIDSSKTNEKDNLEIEQQTIENKQSENKNEKKSFLEKFFFSDF